MTYVSRPKTPVKYWVKEEEDGPEDGIPGRRANSQPGVPKGLKSVVEESDAEASFVAESSAYTDDEGAQSATDFESPQFRGIAKAEG